MTEEDRILSESGVAEIEARASAATPGPWQARFIYRVFQSARRVPDNLFGTHPEQDWPDSNFIANARADIPALCCSLRQAMQRLRVVTEDRNLLYSEIGEIRENEKSLNAQLYQVRTENERLASQLKEWQEEKDTKAGYL